MDGAGVPFAAHGPPEDASDAWVDVKTRLQQNGISALQREIEPPAFLSAVLVRTLKSFLSMDTLTQNVEAIDFVSNCLQTIFAQPFHEKIRGDEMQLVWNEIPNQLEAEGMPPFILKLSKHIAAEAKYLFVLGFPTYRKALLEATDANEVPALKDRLDKFWDDSLAVEDDNDPWAWSQNFEEILRRTEEAQAMGSPPSDHVLDLLDGQKQRILFSIKHYRSTVMVQISRGKSMQDKVLALGTSFAFAAWSVILNYFSG